MLTLKLSKKSFAGISVDKKIRDKNNLLPNYMEVGCVSKDTVTEIRN